MKKEKVIIELKGHPQKGGKMIYNIMDSVSNESTFPAMLWLSPRQKTVTSSVKVCILTLVISYPLNFRTKTAPPSLANAGVYSYCSGLIFCWHDSQ